MRIDYHFLFLMMINREKIALFPAIEVSVALFGRGLRKVRLGSILLKKAAVAAQGDQ